MSKSGCCQETRDWATLTWYLTGSGSLHLCFGITQQLNKCLNQILSNDILTNCFGKLWYRVGGIEASSDANLLHSHDTTNSRTNLDKPLRQHIFHPPALVSPTSSQLFTHVFFDQSLRIQTLGDGNQIWDS
jgi:hypothetical protein